LPALKDLAGVAVCCEECRSAHADLCDLKVGHLASFGLL